MILCGNEDGPLDTSEQIILMHTDHTPQDRHAIHIQSLHPTSSLVAAGVDESTKGHEACKRQNLADGLELRRHDILYATVEGIPRSGGSFRLTLADDIQWELPPALLLTKAFTPQVILCRNKQCKTFAPHSDQHHTCWNCAAQLPVTWDDVFTDMAEHRCPGPASSTCGFPHNHLQCPKCTTRNKRRPSY